MINVAEARHRILAATPKLGVETVPLTQALGRVLANDLSARLSVPRLDVSSMDGYACRSQDVANPSATLMIADEVSAGSTSDYQLQTNEACRIFTGAPLPAGADCVIIQENVDAPNGDVIGQTITTKEAVTAGQNVRRAGGDFKEGSIELCHGHKMTARDIGLAAAMNHSWVNVVRKPKIGILVSGDELSLPGTPMTSSQIISSNSYLLASQIEALGAIPVILPIVGDDEQALQTLISQTGGLDILLTSGGASVGNHDYMRASLEKAGYKEDFWKVAMRPGKPLFFGLMHGTPVLGLPGNPVSSYMCAMLFLAPMISHMKGLGSDPVFQKGILSLSIPAIGERETYIGAKVQWRHDQWEVMPFVTQDSSLLSVLSKTNAVIRRFKNAEAAKTGEVVDIMFYPKDC